MVELSKYIKWCISCLRLCACMLRNQSRLKIKSGKPLYLGKDSRVVIAKNGSCELGSGVYISRNCLIQVDEGAELRIGSNVYLNDNVHIVAHKSISIGNDTLFGPNVCVYDHDHFFSDDGVLPDLVCSPVAIGSRCWIAANSVITRGTSITEKVLVGSGSIVTRPIKQPGVYVGSPAKLVATEGTSYDS